ncbi:MAG: hypothetical protein GQE15_06330 [Archangiaceae bacterium]|nr:hypothetical protein [Archangiaceae bacterium]
MTPVRFLLAVCLGLASSAQAGPKASVREAEVRAIARLSVDGGVAARSVPLAAKVGSSRDHQPAVVVTGSAAEQWVPTFWRAAFVAAAATGSTVLEHEFSLRVDEANDGPSSGMLLASTLVALLRNKKPLANTTMTGALNPDGTIAPVDDALGRLREAASAGVKRFGFPTGNRQQTDTSGAVVDLLSEGQRLGVTVKELGSLDDAYGFLTGDVLPRPAAAKETDLELWPAELAAVAKSSAQVRRQFETERTPYEEGVERVNPGGVAAIRQRLDRIAKQATDFEQGGDAVRGLVVWSAALGMVRVGAELHVLEDEQADSIAAVQRLEEALVRERLEFRQEIELRFPHNNRANDLYAMDLLESIAPEGAEPAPGARVKKLSALAPGSAELGQLAHEFIEELAQSRERVRNGRRFYELYIALPTVKEAPPLETERLAAAFAAASAASYAALEKQLTPDMQDDPTAAELAGAGEILRTERDPRARLVLAARHDIYSAYLVNTYSTLGGSVDGTGVFSVRNTRGLSTQLERARLQVLQSCGRAKREAKMIPLAARLRFLNARAAREGSDRQKTESLAELWIGSWWCELAAGHSK